MAAPVYSDFTILSSTPQAAAKLRSLSGYAWTGDKLVGQKWQNWENDLVAASRAFPDEVIVVERHREEETMVAAATRGNIVSVDS